MDRPARPSFIRNEYVIQTLILFGVVFALFPGTFLYGDVCVPGSLLYQRFPYDDYKPNDLVFAKNQITSEILSVFNNYNLLATRAFGMGEWPLWNDLQLTGTPLLANYQSTVLYPPRLVFRFMEHYMATTFFYMLKLWLCGATAYLFARGYGLGIAASRLVSVGWMLSMFNMSWWYLPITDVSAWVPLLMLGVEWIVDERYRRGIFTGAIGATLLLLGGHPESSFAFGLGVGFYFVLRLILERRRGPRLWKALGACSLMWVMAIGVCMSQLVPFLEYLVHSETFGQRAVGAERRPFIHDNGGIALWVPRFYGFTADHNYWDERTPLDNTNFMSLAYAGMGVWFAMSTLLAKSAVSAKERHRRIALVVPSVFAFLLAYGVPIVDPIQKLPFFSSMWPMHHISFAMFAMPVLAALGLQHWGQEKRRLRDLKFPVVLLAMVAFACTVLFTAHFPEIQKRGLVSYVSTQILICAVFALASFVLLALHAVRHRSKWMMQAFWVVLAIDLLVAARDMRPSESRLYLFQETAITTYFQQQPKPYRVCISVGPRIVASMRLGMLVPYGVEEAWGYDGMYPDRVTRYFEEIRRVTEVWHRLEPVLAIDEYVPPPEAGPIDTVKLSYIGILDKAGIWDNTTALPRARLIGKVETAPDANALFKLMKDKSFNPRTTAATEMPPKEPLPNTDSTDLGTAKWVKQTTLTVDVDVEAKERCALIYGDQWFPGWRAYVDGELTELWPAYYCMRGVIVPPGKHRVQFRYEPISLVIGMWASCSTLIITAGASLIILRRRRI